MALASFIGIPAFLHRIGDPPFKKLNGFVHYQLDNIERLTYAMHIMHNV